MCDLEWKLQWMALPHLPSLTFLCTSKRLESIFWMAGLQQKHILVKDRSLGCQSSLDFVSNVQEPLGSALSQASAGCFTMLFICAFSKTFAASAGESLTRGYNASDFCLWPQHKCGCSKSQVLWAHFVEGAHHSQTNYLCIPSDNSCSIWRNIHNGRFPSMKQHWWANWVFTTMSELNSIEIGPLSQIVHADQSAQMNLSHFTAFGSYPSKYFPFMCLSNVF